MHPLNYNFSFADLPVEPGWLEKLMGYPEGEAPEPISSIIHNILKEAPEHTEIQGGLCIFKDFRIRDKKLITVNNLEFLTGKTITGSLRNSEKIALFLMTAGIGIETWSRDMSRRGDSIAGYIIDLLGSEIVESATDLMQARLEEEMAEPGYGISNRYSPGYCDWHISEQQKLFSLLPDNFCGITLTDSSLMIPIKSVSGIIGIGRDVKKMAYNCQICDVQNCIYRDRKVLT